MNSNTPVACGKLARPPCGISTVGWMSRTHAPLALLVALTLALTGCGGVDKRAHKSDSAHSSTAAFASEEEALAAAVAAYGRFTSVSDEIGQAGGVGSERLMAVATGEFVARTIDGYRDWNDKGWRQIGSKTFHDASIQSIVPNGVVVYLCEDISDVDVVDSTGTSVVSATRVDTYFFQVALEIAPESGLVVSGRERWDDRAC
jgi:hypothetical protein